MTHMHQLYTDLKDNRPGATLLFRLGENYEAYFGDALTLSIILDIKYQQQIDCGDIALMCRIPADEVNDEWIKRLDREYGIKIVLVEEKVK